MKTLEETMRDGEEVLKRERPKQGWAATLEATRPRQENSSTESTVKGALEALEMYLEVDAEARQQAEVS